MIRTIADVGLGLSFEMLHHLRRHFKPLCFAAHRRIMTGCVFSVVGKTLRGIARFRATRAKTVGPWRGKVTSHTVHQCARFSTDPKTEHAQAPRWLGRHSKATRRRGTTLKPATGKDMEVCADADFSGNWHAEESWDRDAARSRRGFTVMHAAGPTPWKSQPQNEIALSSAESKHTGLSHALRDATPTMELPKEMKALNFPVQSATPTVHCKTFEDNSGALEIASVHKFRPRTKHLNVKPRFFRNCMIRKEITVNAIHTSQQLTDCLTKPVNKEMLSMLRPQGVKRQRG
jgi:hypothetical protein